MIIEIGTVLQNDQRIAGPARMLSSGQDGEAQRSVVGDRLVQIGDRDDDVVDRLKHQASLTGPFRHESAGGPSVRGGKRGERIAALVASWLDADIRQKTDRADRQAADTAQSRIDTIRLTVAKWLGDFVSAFPAFLTHSSRPSLERAPFRRLAGLAG